MNARSRCCRSFVRALNSKSMPGLVTGEIRRTLLQIMGDAFLEILGIEARKHLMLRAFERFLKRLKHRFIHLALDHLHRTRAHIRRQVLRILINPIEKSLLRKHAICQSHTHRFGGVDGSRREQQIERVRMTDNAREHPGHPVFRNQSSASEDRAEPRRIGCESEVAIESDDQPQTYRRAVNRSDHRLFCCEKIRIPFLEVRSSTFRSLSPGVTQGSFPYLFGRALFGHRAKKRYVGARAKSAACAGQNDKPYMAVSSRFLNRGPYL